MIHTTLLLTRHGQTIDNVNQIMQGQTQGQLTAEGVKQAEALALQMAQRPIDAFVSSDLKRAIDTCSIIAQPHGAKVVTTSLLRERDWGSFTGRFIPDLKDVPWTDDIETMEAMKQRASLFLDFIRTHYAGQTVLAVGHGIINKAIQSVFYDKPANQIVPMKNAEVRCLELT